MTAPDPCASWAFRRSLSGKRLQMTQRESPVGAPAAPSLAQFLRRERTACVDGAWERMTQQGPARTGQDAELRQRAIDLLVGIAADLETETPRDPGAAMAATAAHALAQAGAGFTLDDVADEFQALRHSVLEGWKRAGGAIARDTDERDRFETAMNHALVESMKSHARRIRTSTDLFVGTLAHDIRSPLGAITMGAEYIRRTTDNPRIAAQITNSALRIAGILEQVTDFTRGQSAVLMPIARCDGNLEQQALKLVDETRMRFPGRCITFESSGDFRGWWDEVRLGQLLANLLGNALRYGSVDGEVTVRLRACDEDSVELSVHNLGTPIPAGEQALIFDPLVRGGNAVADPGQGLGLGLFICREIARAHGGEVRVVSSEQAGTVFTATLKRSSGP